MQETQETRVRFLGLEDLLEEKMATHSGRLAWKIPRMEEPGGLQSIGVAHSWTRLNNWAHTCIDIYMTLMLSAFLSQFWCTLYFSSLQSKKHTAWLFHEGLWWVSVREVRGLSPRIPHTKHCSPGRCPENLPCALQGGNLIHQRICDLDFSFD